MKTDRKNGDPGFCPPGSSRRRFGAEIQEGMRELEGMLG